MPESRFRSKFTIMKELISKKKCSDRGESGSMNKNSLLWVSHLQTSKNSIIDLPLQPQKLEMVMEMTMMVVVKKEKGKKEKGKKEKKGKKKGGKKEKGDKEDEVIKIGPTEVITKFEEQQEDYIENW